MDQSSNIESSPFTLTPQTSNSSSISAKINPLLLVWARESCRMDIAYASGKLEIDEKVLSSWESGKTEPTIKQLRDLAYKYRINFGALFLAVPPEAFKPPVKDYRFHHGAVAHDLDPEISIELRLNLNARGTAIELEDDLGNAEMQFQYSSSLDESPSIVAERIRESLGISLPAQKKF